MTYCCRCCFLSFNNFCNFAVQTYEQSSALEGKREIMFQVFDKELKISRIEYLVWTRITIHCIGYAAL